MSSRLARFVFVATIPISIAHAQTITTLVKDGDSAGTSGTVTDVLQVAVNNSGVWLVHADTVAATASSFVVLRNGAVFLRQGLTLVPGGALSFVGPLSINSGGNAGLTLFMDSLPANVDSGVFFNSSLLIQEGNISLATTGTDHFSANTPYKAWFDARINDNHQMLTTSTVDDPSIPSVSDRALVIATLTGPGGLASEAVLCREGSSLGTGGQVVEDLDTESRSIGFNNVGQAIFLANMTGPTTTDGYVVVGTPTMRTVEAQEGAASPIAGRNYGTLLGQAVDINDPGDFVFVADLDGSSADDVVILKNASVVVAREGAAVPGVPGFALTSFGTGAVRIDNSSNVFWFGKWNDPNTTHDTGLFRNNQLLVQEGVTMVGGVPIEFIADTEYNFAISPNGRYLIFRGRLQGGVDAAFLLDFGGPALTTFCFGDGTATPCPCGNTGAAGNGCANTVNAAGGHIAASGSASLSNDTLVLTSTGLPNGPGLYFQGTTQIGGGSGVVFGDGLRCAGGTVVRLGNKTASSGTSSYPSAGDPNVSIKGMVTAPGTRTYQLWYRNAGAFCTSSTFNLTNGIQIIWGL